MLAIHAIKSLNRTQRDTFIAAFLGWTLDAFDFLIVTLVAGRIAEEFRVGLAAVLFSITLTLVMRPVGALVFGILADRFGRRFPLMVDIILYSAIDAATAFSPNYVTFLLWRAVFGIAMGGEWGLGASLAMEVIPIKARGFFSGVLIQGYPCGYLLATAAYAVLYSAVPSASWRAMFLIGAAPSLLVLFMRMRVPESQAWEQQSARRKAAGISVWRTIKLVMKRHPFLFLYVILFMTAMSAIAHGTQDAYPSFLQKQLAFDIAPVSILTIIGNVGAIVGGIFFGHFSQYWGRRRAIIIAASLGILIVPLWVGFVHVPGIAVVASLAIGAFLLQFTVGAWGPIPAHLMELSPSDVRGTFPGVAYQLGSLVASFVVTAEALIAVAHGEPQEPDYAFALGVCALGAFLAVIFFTAIGREARGSDLMKVTENHDPS